jgi:hypothetical protein
MKGLLLYFAAVLAALAGLRSTLRHSDLVLSGPPGTRTPNLRIKSPQLCH